MAKRKQPTIRSDKPVKRSKGSGHTSDLPTPADNGERTEVRWVLPTTGAKNPRANERENVTRYAPILYNQPWNAIRTTQAPFNWPFLRTPVFTKAGNDRTPEDKFQMTQALCDLFNSVMKGTTGNREYAQFARHVFDDAFANAGGDSALVASSSATSPVLVLDQDRQAEV